MEFLEKFALYPSENHLELLRFIFVLLFVIHLPYLGFTIGSAAISLLFHLKAWREENDRYARFSAEVIRLAVGNFGAVAALGWLPLITMGLIFAQAFQRSSFHVLNYFSFIFLLAFVGFLLLVIYQRSRSRGDKRFAPVFGIGLLGFLLLVGVLFHLSAVFSLAATPEKWPFVSRQIPGFAVANEIPHFLLLFSFSMAFAAVAQAFLQLNAVRSQFGKEEGHFVRTFFSWTGLLFSLLMPLFIVWNLYTLPGPAQTAPLFLLWMVALFLLLFLALALGAVLNQKRRALTTAFVLALLAYLPAGVAEQQTATQANRDFQEVLALEAQKEHEKILEVREERLAALNKIDGKTVYDKVCSACHRFDRRLVGPPFKEVVPKYQGKIDDLVAFILNPTKKNPGYPPMPKPNVKKAEARAVAEYLLQQVGQQK